MGMSFAARVSGNKEELKAFLQALKKYVNGNNLISFFSLSVETDEGEAEFDELSEDEFQSIAENGTFSVKSYDLDADFDELEHIDLFEQLAKVAPNGAFQAEFRGGYDYNWMNFAAELKDHVLHVTEHSINFEDQEADRWIDYESYFQSKLPYINFIKLFRIDPNQFNNDDDYFMMITEHFPKMEISFTDMDYYEFAKAVGTKLKIEEDEYERVMEKIKELHILDYEDFVSAYPPCKEYNYDPLKKVNLPSYELTDEAVALRQKEYESFINSIQEEL